MTAAGEASVNAGCSEGVARAGASGAPAVTCAIDIGGTGLKAALLSPDGTIEGEKVRRPTTYPLAPDHLVADLAELVKGLGRFDRVSAGFPGVVRAGLVRTAPHFVTVAGPGSSVDLDLEHRWHGFDLAGALAAALERPTRVANDADLQGWGVVRGVGLEMVVTLGTGVGSALFNEGRLAPHLELAQHRFRKGQTYNGQLGDAALQRIGVKKWRRRVERAILNFATLVNYDQLYIGGGNARHLEGHCDPSIELVDNLAGILGGIKLWELGGPLV